MKGILFILSVLFAVSCANNQTTEAQPAEQSSVYTINSSLPVTKQCDMEWILRYEDKHIKTLRERAVSEPSDCDVMFFGSSSIRLWKSLKEDFAPLTVVNRGYGGATLRDLHYNYNTVMAHYKPKAFVFYCDNDLRTKPEIDITVGELFDLVRLLF